jgi:hypothetical protein
VDEIKVKMGEKWEKFGFGSPPAFAGKEIRSPSAEAEVVIRWKAYRVAPWMGAATWISVTNGSRPSDRGNDFSSVFVLCFGESGLDVGLRF